MKQRSILITSLIAMTLWGVGNGSIANAQQFSTVNDYLNPGEEKTISMDFKNAQLNDILKLFSQQSGLNFIASNSVAGKTINLYLDNVPVQEALERILRANNLTYELTPGSNIFVVKELQLPAKDLITRVYQLKYATVPSSKLKTTFTLSGDSSGQAGGGGGSSEEGASSGILAAINAILSPDGKVIEDSRTNSLIITDIPAQFPMIEQTIARLDISVPQVLIEVEMLDISKSSADLLGVKWGNAPVSFQGAERDDLIPFANFFGQKDIGEKFTTADAQSAVFSESRYRVSTLSFSGLTFTLNFLRTQTDTKSLARPRILTLNNETASIEILTDEVIGVTQEISATQGIGSQSTTAERAQTGVSLKVTPQANVQTGDIILAVEPKVKEARSSSGVAASANFKDPEERSTKSILRIKDGDTVVIGGLLRTDMNNVRSRLPFFSKIPLVGSAFRHKSKDENQRELVVFLTPHIIQENQPVRTKIAEGDMVREQRLPSKRVKAIDKELNRYDK